MPGVPRGDEPVRVAVRLHAALWPEAPPEVQAVAHLARRERTARAAPHRVEFVAAWGLVAVRRRHPGRAATPECGRAVERDTRDSRQVSQPRTLRDSHTHGDRSRQVEPNGGHVQAAGDSGWTQGTQEVGYGAEIGAAEGREQAPRRRSRRERRHPTGRRDEVRQQLLQHQITERAAAVLGQHHEPLHPVGRVFSNPVPQPLRDGAASGDHATPLHDDDEGGRLAGCNDVVGSRPAPRGEYSLAGRPIAPDLPVERGDGSGVLVAR